MAEAHVRAWVLQKLPNDISQDTAFQVQVGRSTPIVEPRTTRGPIVGEYGTIRLHEMHTTDVTVEDEVVTQAGYWAVSPVRGAADAMFTRVDCYHQTALDIDADVKYLTIAARYTTGGDEPGPVQDPKEPFKSPVWNSTRAFLAQEWGALNAGEWADAWKLNNPEGTPQEFSLDFLRWLPLQSAGAEVQT